MKKMMALALCLMLICTGCGVLPKGNPTPMPTVTAEPTADPTAEPTPEPTAEPTAEPTPEPTAEPKDEWTNILLLGGDSRSKKEHGRTDAMVILSVNGGTGGVKLTSLMRDTWVKVPGKGSRKINAANVYGGPELAMRTVNENFGTDIDRYVLVNMRALADIIDVLGGVDIPHVTAAQRRAVNSQLKVDARSFKLADSSPLEKHGDDVRMTGNQALAFARIRNIDSDYQRVNRQRTVLVAMAQRLKGMGLAQMVKMIPVLVEHVRTNLSMGEMMALASAALNADLSAVEQMRLPADGTFKSGVIDGEWKIVPDYEKNRRILRDFIYG